MSTKKSIVVIGGLPSSLINFRGDFLRALMADGWTVTAMAGGASEEDRAAVEALGVSYRDYPIQRNGLSVKSDLQTFFALRRALADIKPDVVFSYTIKPVIWGGLATRFAGRPKFLALITGLGFTFQKSGFLKSILRGVVSQLYKLSLMGASKVIFQNSDNRQVFESRGLVKPSKAVQVSGSGVNIERYVETPIDTNETKFLLIARLLYDKGISEYIEAAKIVKARYPQARFLLVGPGDPSPNAFPIETVTQLDKEGVIEYLGEAADVRPHLQGCQIYVLPSYHEGLPRTVIEAMSTGRPVITTDVPGCRDTVIEGETGLLVPVKDAVALSEGMMTMIEKREAWQEMGRAGREFAERTFDVNKVNRDLLSYIHEA
ncbi:glycosyltransferase involved in cell wall biosynthesis [Litorimonas taeanensis]|uniref:Glycosyltransferase involved in cell wall biosynthesis n=1 Tax=Litorimonas taeanensis TaxID=568099 RepID=A0A420WDM1_9PROT|nr:glycosyltransferase family 4 protein [Litorimonas taeanensis]RKQ69086.1 glycosyltransferase involved in cell wall biosynthesis [Litorimonas taeanensis]